MKEKLNITGRLQWQNNQISINGNPVSDLQGANITDIIVNAYKTLVQPYPKFFKMDIMSKAAFVATEILLQYTGNQNTEYNNRTAVILSTVSGCIDVDKKFEESRKEIASPALFVYTLPNIMLGEICIKNKFKGEQLCTIVSKPEPERMLMTVTDLIENRGTRRCLFGHIEVNATEIDITLAMAAGTPCPI